MENVKLSQLVRERSMNLRESIDGELWTLDTGFDEFDRRTQGLRRDDLVVIAARPAMGRITFAHNLVYNLAAHDGIDNGTPVLLFSMEMTRGEVADRMLSDASNVSNWKIRSSLLEKEELRRIGSAVEWLEGASIYVNDTTHMTMQDFVAEVRETQQERGLGAVVIDDIELLLPYDKGSSDYERRLDEVTHGLKNLARELEIPIIVTVGILRYEGDGDPEPTLADLSQYGSLVRDASIVIFLHRPDYYERNDSDWTKSNITELLIRKNVHGPVTTVEICFDSEKLKFVPLEVDGIDEIVESEEDATTRPLRVQRSITEEMIKKSYELAKEVYNSDLEMQDAISVLEEMGMNSSSAWMYLDCFGHMINGECYKRDISKFAVNYYVDSIAKDFGDNSKQKAIEAVRQNFLYRKEKGYDVPWMREWLKSQGVSDSRL